MRERKGKARKIYNALRITFRGGKVPTERIEDRSMQYKTVLRFSLVYGGVAKTMTERIKNKNIITEIKFLKTISHSYIEHQTNNM